MTTIYSIRLKEKMRKVDIRFNLGSCLYHVMLSVLFCISIILEDGESPLFNQLRFLFQRFK